MMMAFMEHEKLGSQFVIPRSADMTEEQMIEWGKSLQRDGWEFIKLVDRTPRVVSENVWHSERRYKA